MSDAPSPPPAEHVTHAGATYEERLWPGPLGWVLTSLFGLVLGVILVPVSVPAAVAVAGVGLVGALAAMAAATPRVAVVDGELLAGRARIPLTWLGEVTTLDRAGVRTAMGPDLDARAYVCVRAWVGGAVQVELRDPHDPTPYWLVSTRHPQRLAAALAAAAPAR
ncbi:DUF3093 domain-containing protein [Cellulomonas soli]|uniref:DUF3093 domain-containing protein n=1 Tax=Cellulomonas soli TaxID=931535 RepID=UPI003F85EBEC